MSNMPDRIDVSPCVACGRSHKGQGGAYWGPACPLGEHCCTAEVKSQDACPVCGVAVKMDKHGRMWLTERSMGEWAGSPHNAGVGTCLRRQLARLREALEDVAGRIEYDNDPEQCMCCYVCSSEWGYGETPNHDANCPAAIARAALDGMENQT